MNAYSVFADLFRPRPGSPQPEAPLADDELLRLPPVVDRDALPPGFEDVLEVQVLAYRERLAMVAGRPRRVLDPVWTLVPRDR
jgi:hypothetical protein